MNPKCLVLCSAHSCTDFFYNLEKTYYVRGLVLHPVSTVVGAIGSNLNTELKNIFVSVRVQTNKERKKQLFKLL